MKIKSENRNPKRKVDLSKVKRVASFTLKELRKKSAKINIVFFSNQKVRALNRRYFGRDTSTDVIAFPAGPGQKGKNAFWPPDEDSHFLGEIAISSDKAYENAKVCKTSFFDEIALYVIHGILHLAGYEDTTKKKKDLMRRKENDLFQKAKRAL